LSNGTKSYYRAYLIGPFRIKEAKPLTIDKIMEKDDAELGLDFFMGKLKL